MFKILCLFRYKCYMQYIFVLMWLQAFSFMRFYLERMLGKNSYIGIKILVKIFGNLFVELIIICK